MTTVYDEFKKVAKRIPLEFPEDEVILSQVRSAEKVGRAFVSELKVLSSLISDFQKDCEHKWEPVFRLDLDHKPSLRFPKRGMSVYVGRKCLICKLLEERSQGPPWEICYSCGGNMFYQGEANFCEVRGRIYKCKDCGHEYDRF
jgi:hypothetical protein